jgi:hypothetical protein
VGDLSSSGRQAAADKGHALPGGAYPIRNRAELVAAVKSFGRAKNPYAAKRHIIKRARELNATHLLPDSWNMKQTPRPSG